MNAAANIANPVKRIPKLVKIVLNLAKRTTKYKHISEIQQYVIFTFIIEIMYIDLINSR